MRVHGFDLGSEHVAGFCRKWQVRELCAFGSILRDDFGPSSDIDLLVDFDESAEWDLIECLDMEEDLTGILGRKADIVSRWAVEHDSNKTIRHEVLSTAEVVYAQG